MAVSSDNRTVRTLSNAQLSLSVMINGRYGRWCNEYRSVSMVGSGCKPTATDNNEALSRVTEKQDAVNRDTADLARWMVEDSQQGFLYDQAGFLRDYFDTFTEELSGSQQNIKMRQNLEAYKEFCRTGDISFD